MMAGWIAINPLPALVMLALTIAVCVRRLLASARVVESIISMPLVQRIDALLPQTQCGHCGYPGCKPYAQAIADGDAFNKCLPGGDATVRNLAQLLDQPLIPLDAPQPPPLSYAFIREAECIGCTKCIQACPVDAILGAAKLMHTIIRDECTGCDLCVEPCPVDCIEMRPFEIALTGHLIASDRGYDATSAQRHEKADHYRQRFEAHQTRMEREQQEKAARRQQRLAAQTSAENRNDTAAPSPTDDKLAIIAAALARSQAKKAAQTDPAEATTSTDTEINPAARLQREIAAIDKRLIVAQEKLTQAQADNAADKIAALQTALEMLQQKREAAQQALQAGDQP
jgi:electron transport complex protein RnfB